MLFLFVQRHTESACSAWHETNDISVQFMNALGWVSVSPPLDQSRMYFLCFLIRFGRCSSSEICNQWHISCPNRLLKWKVTSISSGGAKFWRFKNKSTISTSYFSFLVGDLSKVTPSTHHCRNSDFLSVLNGNFLTSLMSWYYSWSLCLVLWGFFSQQLWSDDLSYSSLLVFLQAFSLNCMHSFSM